jgi:uncharacterized membrane protein
MMHTGRFFYEGMFWGHSLLGSVWFWLIALGVVVAVVAAIYLIAKGKNVPNTNQGALETLDMKFAKGEITQEEYQSRKSVINERR